MPSNVKHNVWTQGLTRNLKSNGKFEAVEYGEISLEEALNILRNMPPLPIDLKEDSDYCPPQIGFGTELAISHIEEGIYVVFPGDISCSLKESENHIHKLFNSKPIS